MDVTKMTLEGFFLADYERLRAENDELKDKLRHMRALDETAEYGITDLKHKTEMVKVRVVRDYNLTAEYGFTSKGVREAAAMTDEELWDWGITRRRSRRYNYDHMAPIVFEQHTYQYTVRVVESRMDEVFATDGTEGSELLPLKDWEGEECLDVWRRAERLDEIKRAALEELRDALHKAGDRLEKQEAEQAEKEANDEG